jgi:D-alanine-D-alanine ligase-like ATP-grasp enzyme
VAELPADRAEELWQELTTSFESATVIVKPVGDGCSAGVVQLANPTDLRRYLRAVEACNRPDRDNAPVKLVGDAFTHIKDGDVVEMPETRQDELLFEEYIATKTIETVNAAKAQPAHLRLDEDQQAIPWVEITVGVLGHQGAMRVLPPSLPLAASKVLSLEEKFMGGTGINLTPPPGPREGGPVEPHATEQARKHIGTVAEALGLEGYARIDAFMHCTTGQIKVIEVNTLPGLAPSTVIFQQAVAEAPKLRPRELLEAIIELSLARP